MIKVVVILFWFLFALSAEAVACSCLGPPAPCQSYWEVPVIFAGTVSDISTVERNKKRHFGSRRLVRFNVQEAYRGLNGTEAEVSTGLGDADCGYPFSEGAQYLVYAYRQEDGSLSTGICSRTRRLSDATDDLEYIRGLSSAPSGATVFGEVRAQIKRDEKYEFIKGAKIIIEGGTKQIETTTDEKGRYRVSGLPADTYKVRAAPPEGFNLKASQGEAKVFDRGCAQIDFWLEPPRH